MKKPIFNTDELFDIEPLIAPGFDWGFWLPSAFLVIAGVLVLLVALYLLRFLYRPQLFKWQLAQMVKKVPKSQETLSKEELFTLYDWLKRYRVWLKSTGQAVDNVQINALITQVDTACFSQRSVSRETFLDLISQSHALIKLSTGYVAGFTQLKKVTVRSEKWK